jgi:2',3'-cyclic-nucleotide 2'-phosphodiesterase (5'-nucleotidase family)
MLVENYNVRFEETTMGDFITDAVAEYTGADIAFVNGGAIRASFYKGDVYGADLDTVCPYNSNHIIVTEVKGSVIKEMLENAISKTEIDSTRNIPNGRFLQVHGLNYSYTPAVENVSDAVLVSVTLTDGSELDLEKTYTVAYSDYMAGTFGYLDNNGDGYTMLNLYSDDLPKAEGVTLIEETNATLSDILKDYFAKHTEELVYNQCEGRITVVK